MIYQDQTPVISASTARAWTVSIRPSRTCRPPNDPDLIAALDKHFSTDLPGASDVVETTLLADKVPCSVMLDHCHALSAWANVLTTPGHGRPLLIHADAHDDLGTPSILMTDQPTIFRSIIDNDHLDFHDPTSIRRFLRRGFIGIGSFIVPALHACCGFDILHVIPFVEEISYQRTQGLKLGTEPAGRSGDSGRRPIINRKDDPRGADGFYWQSMEPELGQTLLSDQYVWLDIDLDVFCNRFDTGDAGDDVTDRMALKSMERMIDSLKAKGVLSHVAVLTIALSPDFFPSRLWPEALSWIEQLKSETDRAIRNKLD